MAQQHSRIVLAFGDVHISHQNGRAVEVVCRAAEHLKPDLGRRNDTLYTIPILNDRCILPGGMEVAA